MDPEFLYYSTLDPFFHLKTAVRIYFHDDDNMHIYKSDDGCGEALSVFDVGKSDKAAQIFAIRFHQAETLLTILCAGNSRYPILKFLNADSKSSLSKFVSSISNRSVWICRSPISSDFSSLNDFIEFLIFRRFGIIENIEEYTEFIVFQAKLFNDRSAYNAIKHGSSMSGGVLKSNFFVDDRLLFGSNVDSISWVRWFHKRDGDGFEYRARNIEIIDHLNAIFYSSLIVNLIKVARIASINGNDDFSARLLRDFCDKTSSDDEFCVRIKLSERR